MRTLVRAHRAPRSALVVRLSKSAAVAGILCAATNATAQVLYEPFDYANNSNLNTNINPAQGTAWTAVLASGNLEQNKVTSPGNLSDPTGTLPASIGGKLPEQTSVSNNNNADRIAFGQVVTSGTIYYSYLLHFDTFGTWVGTGILRVAGFSQYAGTAATQTGLFSSLNLRKTSTTPGAAYQLGISKMTSVAADLVWDTAAGHSYTTSDTLFVVGSYTFNTGSTADDVAQLWVNPAAGTYGTASPPSATLTSTSSQFLGAGTNSDAPDIASFFYRPTSGSTYPPEIVDELRVDSSWAGVTPLGTLQKTFTGSAGDGNKWSTDGNWSGAHPTGTGAVAKIGPGISAGTIDVDTAQTVGSIQINNSGSLTISGAGGLTFDTNASAGDVTVTGGNHTLSTAVTLNKDLALKVATGSTLTLGSAATMTGTRTITKYGGGTLQLGASNLIDDTATLAVGVGTLDLNGNSETVATVRLGSGSPILGNAVTSPSDQDSADYTSGTISGSGTLTAGSYDLQSGTISSSLAGTGGVTKNTFGSVTLSGSNSYSGTTTVNLGTLVLSGTNSNTLTAVINALPSTIYGLAAVPAGEPIPTLSMSADSNLGPAPGSATPGNITLAGTLFTNGNFELSANRGIAIGPGSGTGTGTISVNTGKTVTYAGIITNNGSGTGYRG
jgi:autotransporter-associated beta strand protein